MQPERAVRIALSRLFAIRHDRPVPFPELAWEAAKEGILADEVRAALASLQKDRLAVETRDGWRPAALPLLSRAREPMAAFGWIHS